jgi:hypothetical protein
MSISLRSYLYKFVLTTACIAIGLLAGAAPAFAEVCPNEAARSGPSASLPECRAYEMVTPADKSTIVRDLSFSSGAAEGALSAADGNRVVLVTHIEGFGQTPEPFDSFVMFTRTASGWQTESVNPPGSGGTFYEGGLGRSVFTPDLTEVALISDDEHIFPTSPDQSFQVGPPGGPFTVMATEPISENDYLDGATPDFSSIFFESKDHTLAGSPTGTVGEDAHDVYRWEGGKLSVVNVNADGSPVNTCGANFKAVSEDGSKVFFMAPDSWEHESSEPSCQRPRTLYMREGNSIVELSKGLGAVQFMGASADGSKVFFTAGGELYEYDTLTSTVASISSAGIGEDSYVQYVLPSQDGSRVYFSAEGKLTPEAPVGGGLYRYNTDTGETHFITPEVGSVDSNHSLGELEDGGMTMRASQNGKFLIYFLEEKSTEENQVYRYDDENEQLTCVSCLPANAPKDKASEFGESDYPLIGVGLTTSDDMPLETFVSNDGNVFFESTAQLVPQAVNATGGGLQLEFEDTNTDVYEWHDGVVSLIGSPSDPYRQHLVGISEDGSNVFFVTHSQLVPQDIDSSGDIYDARVDGGFPPVTESAACEGDTCLHLPPVLNDPTPGSLSFSGPGNPSVKVIEPSSGSKPRSKHCAKGTVRKGGKCVRRRKARKATHRGGKVAHGLIKHDRGGSR